MNTKLQKLGQFAKEVWQELDDEAKDAYYCDTGTYGFLEDVVGMHHEHLTDEEYEALMAIFESED